MLSDLKKFRQVLVLLRLKPFDETTAEGRSKERYRRILLTTITNFITRAAGSLLGLITVPLALSYLGKEKYGLWAVITSMVAWTSLFDFGIMNSLVNVLSEANGRGDKKAARGYVSTAVLAMSVIALIAACIVGVISPFICWKAVLAVRFAISEQTVMWSVLAAVICVLTGFPLSAVRQVYAGYQKAYVGNIFSLLGSIATLTGLLAVVRLHGDLPWLILAFSGPGVMLSVINYFYITKKEMPWISPGLRYASKQSLRRISRTSIPLLLFQVGALMVNETQMITLAHVTNLRLVSEYSVVWRLGITLTSFVGLATSSFVPAFREANERGDTGWMESGFRRMLFLRMMIACIVMLVLVFAGNSLLHAWLHRSDFHYPTIFWVVQGIVLVSGVWATAHTDLMTIMDRIWIQVAMVLLNGVVTIVLTVLLAPRYGIIGAAISIGFVTVCLWTWMTPLMAKRFLVFRDSSPIAVNP